jgi:predicted short-subunit dehydrogenase-like oxidoreductase (DUF2520 family)
MITSATIIGSGNVAWHLGVALSRAGVQVKGVYSRNPEQAKALADHLSTTTIVSLDHLEPTDLVLMAVADDAIRELSQFFPSDQLVAHTSGSVAMDQLREGRRGVFYPLQTFSKLKSVELKAVPLCVEAETDLDQASLMQLARLLSTRVELITSEQRKQLHLAAVFVSNFVNQLYREAEQLLNGAQLDFNLLLPLIGEVTRKLDTLSPHDAMTGPARRKDVTTINNQLQMLAADEQLRNLYRLLTDRIIADHQN